MSSLQTFREACGASGPLGLEATTTDGRPAGVWALDGPFAVVGRDARNDVVLPDEQVSGRHVYLQVVDGAVYWVDLESRGGVSRGGIAEPCGWLPLGESLTVGPYQLRLTGGVGPTPEGTTPVLRADPRANRPDPARASGTLSLVLTGSRERGEARFPVTRMLTLVGRSDDCRLRFSDDQVSRFQAALVRTGAGVWVVDLLGRRGLRVNRARARWAVLTPGDTVDFGPYRAEVQAGGRSAQAALPAPSPSRPSGRKSTAPPAVQLRAALVPELLPETDVSGGAAGPLVEQFGLLQRQMFDQFQQMMEALLSAVGTLQRDQMGQVQKELEHIRDVTRELQALQASAEAVRAGGTPVPAAGPPAPGLPEFDGSVPVEPRDVPDPDAHLRVSLRIAELTNDRQGSWQKVLNLLRMSGAG